MEVRASFVDRLLAGLPPAEHPIWTFALAASIATFALTLFSSANPASLLAAGCALTVTILGLRLGFVLAFGVACIPAIVSGRLASTAFSIPWNAALALLLVANLRAVLLISGPALRSGALLSPRPWREASAKGAEDSSAENDALQRGGAVRGSIESWPQWVAELSIASLVLTLAGALFEALAWILGGLISPEQSVRSLSIGALAALGLSAAIVSIIALFEATAAAAPPKARMILTQSLYRELRSELLDLTRRRARGRS